METAENAEEAVSTVRLENISKSYKGVTMLKNVSWKVKKGEKVGLVGVNGPGKTTQLRIIAGLVEPDDGNVIKAKNNMKFPFMSQEFKVSMSKTVKEEFMSAFREEMEVAEKIEKVQKAIEGSVDDLELMGRLLDELDLLQNRAQAVDLDQVNSKINKLMPDLGFSPEADRLVASFSGGWRMRMSLRKILLQGTPKLAGSVNWGTATVIGIFAGMLYGGSKEAAASASKDAEVTLKLGSTPDKREQYRLMRDAMEKRFYRVTRGSLVGGVRLGIFTAAFYGLQNLLAEERGVHDVYNIVAAGSATAATFGLIMPGSLLWRARNVMMGSVLGAAFCFPLGWAHLKLVEKANEEKFTPHPQLNEKGEVKTGLEVAIERLEGSIKK